MSLSFFFQRLFSRCVEAIGITHAVSAGADYPFVSLNTWRMRFEKYFGGSPSFHERNCLARLNDSSAAAR